MDQIAFQVQLRDVIGKPWSEWDLPETISESDLRRGRKVVRKKLGCVDGSDFDNVEKPNRLPSAGMFLFGSYPESDILSISTCSGCSRKYKTQWLHNRHWEKNSSGDYVCTLTKEVVIPHRHSSKHGHHHRKDVSSSSKDTSTLNNENHSLFVKSHDVNNSDNRHHRKDASSSSSKDTTNNENHTVLIKSRDSNNSGSRHHHHHHRHHHHRKDVSSSSKYISISNNQNNSLFIKSRDVNNSDPSRHHHRKDVPSSASSKDASTTNNHNQSLLIKSRDGSKSDSRHHEHHHRKDVSSSSKYVSLSNNQNHSVMVKSRDGNSSDSRHYRKDTSSSSKHNTSLTNNETPSLLIKSQDINNSDSRHNHHSGHHSHSTSFDSLHQQQGSSKSSSSKSINSGSSNSSSSPKNIVGADVKQVDGTISFPPKKKKKKKSRNEPRKIVPLKDRQFDPDQHCGVPNSETGSRCTRSLTCKTHSMALRRAVPGRRIGFDQLLADHKKARDAEKAAKAAVESQLQGGSGTATTPVPIMASAALPTLSPMISSTPLPMIISPVPLTSTTPVPLMTTTTTPVPMLSRLPASPATSHTIMNTINMNPVVTLKQLTKNKTSSPSNNTNVINFVESPSGLPTTTIKSSLVTSTITSSTANNSYVQWSQPVTPLISLSPHSNNSTTVLPTSSPSSSALEFKLQGKPKSKKSKRLLELVQSASQSNDTRTVILSSVLNTSDVPLVCINARTLKAALKQKKFHRTTKVVPTIFKTQRKHETAAILMDLSIQLKKFKKHKRIKQESSTLTNGKNNSSSTNILDRAQTVNQKKNNTIFSWSNSIHRNPLDHELSAQELREAATLIQTSAQNLCKFSSVEEKDI